MYSYAERSFGALFFSYWAQNSARGIFFCHVWALSQTVESACRGGGGGAGLTGQLEPLGVGFSSKPFAHNREHRTRAHV